MKVKEIMTQNMESCRLTDSLKKAAEIVRRENCPVVSVIDEESAIIGVVTRENICQAIAALDRKSSSIKIEDIKFDEAYTCSEDEKIEQVLKKMSRKRVTRLIVTSQDDAPVGIISVPDILRLSAKKKKVQKNVFSVLKSIYKPRPLVLQEIEFPSTDV